MFFTCRDLTRNLVELEEGRVPLVHRAVARVHLTFCGSCRAFARQLRQTRSLLVQLRSPAPGAAELEAALTTMRRIQGRLPDA